MRSSRLMLAAALVFAAATCGAGSEQQARPRILELESLEVSGHESLTSREVARILAPDGRVTLDEAAMASAADSLLSRLEILGRPFARVKVVWKEADGRAALDVSIDEGLPAVLASLEVETTGGGVRPGGDVFRMPVGSVVTREALEREIGVVLKTYENAGRPFAALEVAEAARVDDGLDLVVRVEPGPDVRFGRLAVRGNEVTRPRVIERESGVVPGEPYRASVVAELRSRVERLGLFTSVSEPLVSVDPLTGIARVGIEVEEGPASRIEGVIGYSQGAGGEDDLVTGLVDVSLGNIAGTGREATARWERLRRDYTKIGFSYNEPWLLGAPIDLGVRGEQTVNDTIYTLTGGDVFVSARMGSNTRVTWTVGAERYVPGGAGQVTTTSYRTSMSGLYDGTDAPGNPTRGMELRATAAYAAKKSGSGDRDRSGTAVLGASLFLRTARAQVLALRGEAAVIESTEDEVPFHELLPLGGAAGLRGYREEQFRGTRTALASAEYRFLLSRRSRALAFFDLGYYYREGSNPAKDVKLGYGIGLRGETRLGIIAVDYGLGEGDGLLEGKLHVGLTREF